MIFIGITLLFITLCNSELNPYTVLGLDQKATATEIKAAYRKLRFKQA